MNSSFLIGDQMRISIAISAAIISATFTTSAIAATNRSVARPLTTVLQAPQQTIIRSPRDLDTFLRTNTAGSALSNLSTGARLRFLRSLTWNEKGVTSFEYGDLQSELTKSQAFAVLRMFGIERTISLINARVVTQQDRALMVTPMATPVGPGGGGDYKEYYCQSHATCYINKDHICLSDC